MSVILISYGHFLVNECEDTITLKLHVLPNDWSFVSFNGKMRENQSGCDDIS